MKRAFLIFSALFLFASMVSLAFADTDLGQHCWEFDQHIDTLRVSANQGAGLEPMFNLHARWRASNLYQQLGSGELTESLNQQYRYEMVLKTSHQTGFFGNNRNCYLNAYLDGNLNGPWHLECVGTNAAPAGVGLSPVGPVFSNKGTMTYTTPCRTAASMAFSASQEREQLPAVGEPDSSGN